MKESAYFYSTASLNFEVTFEFKNIQRSFDVSKNARNCRFKARHCLTSNFEDQVFNMEAVELDVQVVLNI